VCAIAGIISYVPDYGHPSHLNSMLATMRHRGPDGTEIEVLDNAGCFGHNRLSIIDLDKRAKQPMWDSSRRFCLSFNGEIYNFHSLRQELKRLGHQFRTESDSEALIQAWLEWGVESISHLVGMFVFAVWDTKHQQLFLVRDRMGEKPLYYAPVEQNFKNGVIFASELKGLIKYPYIKKKISMTALSHYLSFNYTPTDDSIFQGIYKLPPASYLQYDLNTGECKIREYWTLAKFFQNKLIISYEDAEEQLKNLLSDIVKKELVADVPVGAFLSGGVDSSTIVSHMCQHNKDRVNTYSIGFNEKTYSELSQSKKTAKYLNVNHQTKMVTPDIKNLLPSLMTIFDEPFADTSLIPTYILCGFAKNHVTVSLSGDGGDELFGGYITYQADRYFHLMQRLPLTIRKMLFKLSHHLPTSFSKVSLDYKIKQFLRGSMLDFQQAHLSWREIFSIEQKKALFRFDYHSLIRDENPIKWFQHVADCHYLDQAMYVDMKTWLVDDILVKVDRTSMAHSLEVRTPFLDHRLVEFAASIPIEYKIRRRSGKRILKSSHVKQLPSKVLRHPKKGFNCPISYWLSHEMFDIAYEVTTSSHLCQWFNKNAIEKLWFEHQKGVCDNGYRLFNLLCLGLWCQIYDKE